MSIKEQLNHQIAINRKLDNDRKEAVARAANGANQPQKKRGRPVKNGRASTT
jgi:hypothetical protein